MTYNFDPDRWLEDHRRALAARRARGELDESSYSRELADLERRHEEMVDRLDGSYRLPEET